MPKPVSHGRKKSKNPFAGATGLKRAVSLSQRQKDMKQKRKRIEEIFADADTFRVAIESGTWTGSERWVLFAAAISIDFDFFENNQGSDGLISFGD